MKALVSCLVVAAAVLAVVPAVASPTYPPTIQSDLMLEHMPDCTLCHRDDNGGVGTVIRPFGRTMLNQFMLTGGDNVNLLKAALAADDAAHFDSDGDGVSDIDELRMGTDPNVGASGVETPLDVPLPETGCAFSAGPPGRGGAPLALLFLGLVIFRRRARASRVLQVFLVSTCDRH